MHTISVMHTTLNKLRAHNPCEGFWNELLSNLGKSGPDDDPLPILTILESNGFVDAMWSLCAVEGWDKEIYLLSLTYARQVSYLTTDPRSLNVLDVAERFANGEASKEELDAAARDAYAAYNDAYKAYATFYVNYVIYAAYARTHAAYAAAYAAAPDYAPAYAVRIVCDAAYTAAACDAIKAQQEEAFRKLITSEKS